jgi:hypothetical protein
MNPYLSQFAPQAMQQDIYGQSQVMDTSGRQKAQDAMNTQGSQLASQALGINKNPMSGIDPIKLGMALRTMNDPYAQNKGNPYLNAQTAMKTNDPSNVYGFGGQGQIPMGNGNGEM